MKGLQPFIIFHQNDSTGNIFIWNKSIKNIVLKWYQVIAATQKQNVKKTLITDEDKLSTVVDISVF